eukprot:TRINITY_DN59740_c0_g1_i1.p1 TRINITY_DN59740_c0_g1~~TRINITY_DN59740_c0_g1_i1.p1  ORF type:complete len:606 (-),score=141.12 TRINITY_DN59740_c0_g1_i1:42-1859(-)
MGDCQSKAISDTAPDAAKSPHGDQQDEKSKGDQLSGIPELINVDSEDVTSPVDKGKVMRFSDASIVGIATANSTVKFTGPLVVPAPLDAETIIANASWLQDWTTMPSKLIDPEENDIPLFDEQQFVFLKRLGMGAFGRVIQVLRKADRKMFALKIVDKRRVHEKHGSSYVYRLYLERRLLRTIDHPFFTKLEGVFKLKHLMMFLVELAPCGTLKQVLETQEKFDEASAKLYAAQILLVVTYLHKMSIVHRDLRPDNVLVAADGYLRVTDIGIAAELPRDYQMKRTSSGKAVEEEHGKPAEEVKTSDQKPNEVSPDTETKRDIEWGKVKTPSPKRLKRGESVTGAPLVTVVGAAGWKPPEMQKSQGYDYGADFWNFGVILYIMLVGKHPFTTLIPTADLDKAVLKQTKVSFPKSVSPEAKDLIRKLVEPDPVKRIGSTKAVESPQNGTIETTTGDDEPSRGKSSSVFNFNSRQKGKSLSSNASPSIGSSEALPSRDQRIISEVDEKKVLNFEIDPNNCNGPEVVQEDEQIERFPGDGYEIRRHPFFKGVDWKALEQKHIAMPKVQSRVALRWDNGITADFENLEAVMKEFDNRDVALQLENMMFMA